MAIVHALLNLVMFCFPAAIAGVISAHLSRNSTDEWALLAWLPPLPLFVFGLYLAVVVTRDPTAANLWPLAMAFVVVVTAVLFGAFLLARKYMESDPTPEWQRRDRKRGDR